LIDEKKRRRGRKDSYLNGETPTFPLSRETNGVGREGKKRRERERRRVDFTRRVITF